MPGNPIADLPPLREVIARHRLSAHKSLGQHFLLDLNLTDKIARAAGALDTGTVIEVGPGPGGLTRSLLQTRARKIIAIERDRRCIEALQPLVDAADGRLELLEADAGEIDVTSLGSAPRHIVSNLPYNVGTMLLTGWLTAPEQVSSMTLMFQSEVADRIVAEPGSKSYGRLAILCNWRAETRFLFRLPARAFTPPPKVDSAVVQLIPYAEPLHDAEAQALEAVTRAAFGQRRKMLRSALKSLNTETDRLFDETEIEPTRRAEELSIAEFAALARAFSRLRRSA